MLSFAGVFGVPLALTALSMPGLSALSVVPMLGLYFYSAQALAGTASGPGERSPEEGVIERDAGDLVVTRKGKTVRLPLSALANGWTERTVRAHAAVLAFADGHEVIVEADTEEQAVELLRSLGAGVHARAVRMRGYREDTGGRKLAGCLLALFLPITVIGGVSVTAAFVGWFLQGAPALAGVALSTFLGFVPFLAVTYWLYRKVRATWIRIGADGIAVPGLLGERFVPHSEISNAWHTRGGIGNAYHFVTIGLRNGKTIALPAATIDAAGTITSRILNAKADLSTQERARLLGDLSRNHRPVSEWRGALASVLAKGGYRSTGRNLEEVLRIVEDPAAPAEQRVAAALAARPHGDESVGQRIRVAAEACVEPKIRFALEKASSGEIEDAELEAIAAASAESA